MSAEACAVCGDRTSEVGGVCPDCTRGHVAQEEHRPALCPQCGNWDIVGSEVVIEGANAIQEVSCSACGTEWHDVYELARAVGIRSGGDADADQWQLDVKGPLLVAARCAFDCLVRGQAIDAMEVLAEAVNATETEELGE